MKVQVYLRSQWLRSLTGLEKVTYTNPEEVTEKVHGILFDCFILFLIPRDAVVPSQKVKKETPRHAGASQSTSPTWDGPDR